MYGRLDRHHAITKSLDGAISEEFVKLCFSVKTLTFHMLNGWSVVMRIEDSLKSIIIQRMCLSYNCYDVDGC